MFIFKNYELAAVGIILFHTNKQKIDREDIVLRAKYL